MVIGERFAWAHLPKTGGSATLELFKLFPQLIVHGDFEESNAKHTLFREREDQVSGKLLAMNLRRLPHWVLSRAQHVARWGVYPEYTPIQMDSPKKLSESPFPDSRLEIFTDGGRFRIDRWLRMEHLGEDFVALLSELTDVADTDRHRIDELQPVNALTYDHELEHWFTPAQVESMYEHNPTWARLERELYGDLFRLE